MSRRRKDAAAVAAERRIDEHVGGQIRLRRGLMGMNQAALAKALGVTFQQVQKYERGANRISPAKLFQLTNVLNVPVSFFFDGIGAGNVLPSGSPNDPFLSVQELGLVRAWREAEPAVAEAVAALLRSMKGKKPAGEIMPEIEEAPAAPLPPVVVASSIPPKEITRRRRRGAVWDPADIRTA